MMENALTCLLGLLPLAVLGMVVCVAAGWIERKR